MHQPEPPLLPFAAGAQSARYHADGFDGPSVALSSDSRKKAGFEPALVIDLAVPAAYEPMKLDGSFLVRVDADYLEAPYERSEAWVLEPGPRSPISLEAATEFPSRSSKAPTLYKLYFRLPPSERWLFKSPPIQCGEWSFSLPEHLLSQAYRSGTIVIRALHNEA